MLKKYLQWHCKSFTDDNRNVKWCPYTKECSYAVERVNPLYSTENYVNCLCGNSFCFKCGEELHWPATCKMYQDWVAKFKSESENTKWIIANTKMCPRCKRPIEKSTGCNHMTCGQCKHEFCWMCMGDWKEHN